MLLTYAQEHRNIETIPDFVLNFGVKVFDAQLMQSMQSFLFFDGQQIPSVTTTKHESLLELTRTVLSTMVDRPEPNKEKRIYRYFQFNLC